MSFVTRLSAQIIRNMATQEGSVQALVSVDWLHKAFQRPDIRVLDGSWHMPAWKRDPIKEYNEQHIQGALYFDLVECADKSAPLGHTLPSKETFAEYVGKLGINNNTSVVVYDNNAQFGSFSAQRVWWMFRVFGHERISVLNGGLPKWLEADFDTTTEVAKVEPEKYTARYVAELVRHLEDVEENIKSQKSHLIDARSAGRFDGTMPEPRPEIKSGHIANSKCMPFPSVLDPDNKVFKTPTEIVGVFEKAGISLEKDEIISSCGSGISACTLAFAAFLAGKRDVSIYDGSWTEYFLQGKDANKVLAK